MTKPIQNDQDSLGGYIHSTFGGSLVRDDNHWGEEMFRINDMDASPLDVKRGVREFYTRGGFKVEDKHGALYASRDGQEQFGVTLTFPVGRGPLFGTVFPLR